MNSDIFPSPPGDPSDPKTDASTPTPPGTPTRPDVSGTLDDDSKTVGDASATPLPQGPPPIPDHELLYCAGRGSYGEVWLARNVMGLYRAVKIVHRSSFEHARPFEREFNGIKKFEPISRSHDGFVDILQVGRTEDYFYYVMELADDVVSGQQIDPLRYEAKTLRSEIGNRRKLPFEKCVEVGLSLAAALGHLHKHGLIHRDIKPSNIIFVNGQPKLADIGLVAEQSEAKSFVGTEGFIPPEGPGTSQADIYSLGKVLYEIATGKDRHEFPALPTALGETKEDDQLLELNTVFLKACQNDIHERYQTCEQMREDLLLLRSGESVAAAQVLRKRLALLTKISVVGVTLTVLVLAALAYTRKQAKREAELRSRAEAGEHAARQHLYAANMNLARQAYESGDYGRALELLNLHRPKPGEPDLRHWEWRQLWNLCRGDQITTLRASGREILGLKYLSEDRLLAADIGGPLEIWDLPTQRVIERMDMPYIADIAFSSDNRVVAVGHFNRIVTLWTNGLRSPAFVLRHANTVANVELSPDGTILATEGQNGLTLWDVPTRQVRHHLVRTQGWSNPGFSPDGHLLAYPSRDRRHIALWDVETGEEREVLPIPGSSSEHTFSPDGRLLAVGYFDGSVRLVDLGTKEVRSMTNHTSRVWSIAFSPDGKVMVSVAGSREVVIWDVANWKALSVLRGPGKLISSLAFSPDGRTFATGSKDGTIRFWATNSVTQSRIDIVPPGGAVKLASDGAYVAKRDTNSLITILSTVTMEEKAQIAGIAGETALAVSDDGRWLATRTLERGLRLWDTSATGVVRPTRLDTDLFVGRFQAASFSPDGTHLAVLESNAVLSAWSLPDLRRLAALKLTTVSRYDTARMVVHSPDGHLIATADIGGLLNIIDTTNWKIRKTLLTPNGDCRHIAFSPDNQTIAACGDDETVKIIAMESSKLLATLTGGSGGFTCLAFSQDGKRLAAGAAEIIRVWELEQFQPVASLHFPYETFPDLKFTPGSDSLIALGSVARILRAPTLATIDAEDSDWSRSAGNLSPDSEMVPSHPGAITEWLTLGPMPARGSPDSALDTEQVAAEAMLQPKAGSQVENQGSQFSWRNTNAPSGIISWSDVRQIAPGEASVAYAACYLIASHEIEGCVIEVGSSDDYRLVLNGTQILEYATGRVEIDRPRRYPRIKDRISGVRLNAGTNVLLLKMVARSEGWTGSVKVCDADRNALPNLRVTRVP
ncbi:MAG: PD40 domain-containing protein [Verrucomicrobia bacterium]|nr:PD40 domain-containing protein [Verrucomicrobiota bacterium]